MEVDADTLDDEPAKPVPRWTKLFLSTFPSWLILPLKGILVVAFLLAIMIPVYVDFLRVAKAENEALIWPIGADPSKFDELDCAGPEPGMLELEDDMSLGVSLGHQAIEYDSGEAISNEDIVILAEDLTALY